MNSEQDQDLISINTGNKVMLVTNQIYSLDVSIMNMLRRGLQVRNPAF